MIQTLAIVFYLLPFVALALTLLFLALTCHMTKIPPLSDPRAQQEQDNTDTPFAEPVDESCIIRVTRQRGQYSRG